MDDTCEGPRPTRRGLLLGLAATLAVGGTRLAFARTEGDARLVVVLLRGALDGLFAVQPYGDPAHAGLRGLLALPEPGAVDPAQPALLDLGGFFGMHPALAGLHGLYAADQALVLHAVAGNWRTRSHFEAQDMLETGATQRLSSGWLNRALAAVPNPGAARVGLSIGTGVPLLLRGQTPVGTYAPAGLQTPMADLLHRIAELQAGDPLLGPVFAEGMRARGFAAETLGPAGAPNREQVTFPRLALAAGQLLAAPEGPRVAVMELGGWDTHAGQIPRLTPLLRLLDEGLVALKVALERAWSKTAVLVVTEFGRTVRPNGNNGTDHGTAGAAFLLGGAVAGGRVVADWAGLSGDGLLEDRDLAPTRDLRGVAKGLLREHLKLPAAAVAAAFPGSEAVPAMVGLVR
ncbi:MAG: DUF1501 domain-containing protein [Acetobacteraceae bacterium]|nr:DUF1501 domain-containing protein [Acetobacteraceae bacterium]